MTEVSISYVFPNISTVNRGGRGGLNERWNYALRYNCNFIEMPCDFIKNKTEIKLTGLEMCSIPDKEAIEKIYSSNYNPNAKIKYILHTEPMLSRRDLDNKNYTAKLKWYDDKWLDDFISMLISVIKFLKITPYAIEIHPGKRKNTYGNIFFAATKIIKDIFKVFNYKPLILLENRTGHFISNCKEVSEFMYLLEKQKSDYKNHINFVLDIYQLYKSTKDTFENDLKLIPFNSLKAYHIHTNHSAPDISDEIPWKFVFDQIKEVKNPIIINPEVFHEKNVRKTIDFCNNLLETKI